MLHRISRPGLAGILGLLLASAVAAGGWASSGLPLGHDALAGLGPVEAVKSSLASYGAFPDWGVNSYLGYPLFYMFPSLAQLGQLLLSYLFGWALANKLLFFLFFALSGVFAYLYVYRIRKDRLGAFVAGLAYLFMPIHLIEAVFEGHQADMGLLFMLLPLLLLATDRAIERLSVARVAGAGLVLAAAVLAHPQAMPLLLGPFWGLYVLFRAFFPGLGGGNLRRALMAGALISFLGLLLTAFWWLPLLAERELFHSGKYVLTDSLPYSVGLADAFTMRGASDCALTSGFAGAGSAFETLLRALPAALALVGLVLSRRSSYAWFFAAVAVFLALFAMGPRSPIDVYTPAFNYWPLMSGTRTPARFLFFAAFAYAVLIGLAASGIRQRLNGKSLQVLVAGLLMAAILGNTWQESRAAFRSFDFTEDQRGAIDWLKEQPPGRLMLVPPDTWQYSEQTRSIINPMTFTWFHGKEVVSGGIPGTAPKSTGEYLNSLYWLARVGAVNVGELLGVLGVNYVAVDKTAPNWYNYLLGDDYLLAWESPTLKLYVREEAHPRIFARLPVEQLVAPIEGWTVAEGSRQWEAEGAKEVLPGGQSYDWKLVYRLTGADSRQALVTDFTAQGTLSSVSFRMYVPEQLHGVSLELSLWEADGSRYGYQFAEGPKRGWRELEIPLSSLALTLSEDENATLDLSEVVQLGIVATNMSEADGLREFSLYLGDVFTSSDSGKKALVTQGWRWRMSGDDTYGWRPTYRLEGSGAAWQILAARFEPRQDLSSITLRFYVPEDLPGADLFLSLYLWEFDGSRYAFRLGPSLEQGAHEYVIPLSSMILDQSEDGNRRLDLEKIVQIGIGMSDFRSEVAARYVTLYVADLVISGADGDWPYVADDWVILSSSLSEGRVALSTEYVRHGGPAWRVDYVFGRAGANVFSIGAPFDLDPEATSVSLWYYAPQALQDITLSLGLEEADGSLYFFTWMGSLAEGWHLLEAPFSMFLLQRSEDERIGLDPEQVARIWLRLWQYSAVAEPNAFTIYFSPFLVGVEETVAVDFVPEKPGKYRVVLEELGPLQLVLAESFFPGWRASVAGENVASERVFGFLNGWNIEVGEGQEIVLEFVPGGLRRMARAASLAGLVWVGLALAWHGLRRRTAPASAPPSRRRPL